MRIFSQLFLISMLLYTLALPVIAQDTPGNTIARQRIAEAAASQATSLSLANLELTAIPHEIGILTQLQVLDVSYNQLTDIPAELLNLTNLIVLDLSWNRLGSIPPEIYMMRQLQHLTIYDNGLTAVAPRIGRLSNLTYLGLSSNALTSLPAEIGQLVNLTQLHLENNALTALPAEIGNLAQLCVLHAADNRLRRLPAELGKVTRLAETGCEGITLANNPLVSPPPGVVREGTSAVLAYLRDGAGNGLDSGLFTKLATLAVVLLLSMGTVLIRRTAATDKTKRKRGDQQKD
jgi:Leucine-rich repeat (LRR) protein